MTGTGPENGDRPEGPRLPPSWRPFKEITKIEEARFSMALIVVLIVDLEVDPASRNTSIESASRNGARSNALLHVPTLRTNDTSF